MSKKNMNDRMLDAISEMMMDRRVGYEIPASYYAEKYDVPYEEPSLNLSDEKKQFLKSLTQEDMADKINVGGKTFVRKIYEYNMEHPNINFVMAISQMNIKQISDRFGIPYRTVQNWSSGQRECPSYTLKMMLEILIK